MKKIIAAVLCLVLVFALCPMSAFADEVSYTINSKTWNIVSNADVCLRLPHTGAYLEKPMSATIKGCSPKGGIYIMPIPQEGNGDLGIVLHGEPVTIIANEGGFLFFVTEDGRCGWNGAKFFENMEELENTSVSVSIVKY